MKVYIRGMVAALTVIGVSACANVAEEEGGSPDALASGDSDQAGLAIDENDVAGVEMDMGTGPDFSGSAPKQSSVCVRTPLGPGWVNWGMANPAGSGFSVKPESSWSLVWATPPGQGCDGIYRRSWGCNTALKVPDSCTANVTSTGSVSCCCNAALAALGYVCQWVNPSSPSIGWPACPL